MNDLSKLLYLGNVAGNAGGFLIFIGIFLLAICIIVFCVHNDLRYQIAEKLGGYNYRNETKASEYVDPIIKKFSKVTISFSSGLTLTLAVLCWTIAVFCPSQETVYAIAASEMGESALNTPLASKAGQALEAWIDSKITVTEIQEQ